MKKEVEKIGRNLSESKGKAASRFSLFWDFWGPIIFTFTAYIGIRNYVAEARYIPSGSMLPGLQIQDRLLIEKITLRRRTPRRGEIVVFNSPFSFDPSLRATKNPLSLKCVFLNFPIVSSLTGLADPACAAYIKRVIAIPGDQLLISNKGKVFIDGIKVKEPYVTNYCQSKDNFENNCPIINLKVPQGHVVVLGDNRSNSWDSRFWPGGALLPNDEILGRAIWRFWPISRLGSLSI